MQSNVPITRLGKFFGDRDFELEIGMGQEWLIGDMNYTCVLYKIDRNKIKTDDVYGEAIEDGIKFNSVIPPGCRGSTISMFNGVLGNCTLTVGTPLSTKNLSCSEVAAGHH